mgnify:CR=1 FL=1
MQSLIKELHSLKNPKRIAVYKNFHKTKEGEYASGEEFLGLTISQVRNIANQNFSISFSDIHKLLLSNVHEEKYLACEILAVKYKKSFLSEKKEIIDFYLKNTKLISGWDLVDTTAHQILGDYLLNRKKDVLYFLAKSSIVWEKRISIVSTYAFIKNNQFADTLKIAEILLNDEHDLIHKAVGWMLREVGKRNIEVLKSFLNKHYKKMPRTMLRYAIERFPKEERKAYLKRNI